MKFHVKRQLVTSSILLLCFMISLFTAVPAKGLAAPPGFNLHATYYGFELVEERSVPEIQSVARVFKHTKSGAQLLYLQNDDDNKTFSITFRTPPSDSTGIAHIIEHSVLCGSRKYPAKDPFLQMMKSSLNTFLNAFTAPDKTTYPVASRNDQDFRNLMDVYLDAVFYPNIYDKPEIFQQEGWHYELNDKNGPLTYKGVVYNEMRGVYSSPDGVLERQISGSVLPDTIYNHESGGDPDRIPDLTREQFLAFHHKYYHPSNAYIYLYGNLNIQDTLKFLDENYLSAFDKQEVDSSIALQPPFDHKRDVVKEYSVLPTDDTTDKTYLAMNFVLEPITNWETFLAFNEVEKLLLGSPDAPLKKALTDAGIGKNVYGYIDNNLQPVFSIIVTNANPEDKERFEKTVRQTLKDMIAKGIDKSLLTATFNRSEFHRKESIIGSTNKGLLYNQVSLALWPYGGDPVLPLENKPDIRKKAFAGPYLEKMIQKYLLDNPHSATLVLKPNPGLEQQNAEATADKLAKYKASLSPTEIENLLEQTKKLKELQATPDSPETLAKLPALSLTDIEPRTEKLPLEEKNEAGVKILSHPQFTGKIAYVDLYFDSSVVPQQQLPYLFLLAEVLGKVSTDKHNYLQLSTELQAKTGGIQFYANAYAQKGNNEVYYPKFRVNTKALVGNLPDLMELTGEIIATSNFNDQQRLKELIGKIKAERQAALLDDQATLAASRVLGYISPIAKYNEMNEYSFYRFVDDLEKNFPDKWPEISRNLATVAKQVFTKEGLLVSVVAGKEDYPQFQRSFNKLVDRIGNQYRLQNTYAFQLGPDNEGMTTAGKVQFVAKAYNFRQLGYEYSGKMKVLQTILNTDYLWNRVRVLGGAYGSRVSMDRNGDILFLSWRDPNLKETLDVYQEVAGYLRNFNPTDREMTNYIIATIGKIDAPRTPYSKGQIAARGYLTGLSYTDLQKERTEVLSTTPADIRQFAEMFAALNSQNYLCVVGNEKKLRDNKDLFGKLVNVTSSLPE
ncbi:hypothetical protein SRRS_07960 [Sporomusa rhizae]|uniref:insulinase family protein n=1 Tax=Sporomusa rhizae TaxID=357999 RepID=UPI00352B55E3